jgi:hypothetical protein
MVTGERVRDFSNSFHSRKTSLRVTLRIIGIGMVIGLAALPRLRGQQPVASESPSPAPARSVRLSFLPPPMDGTISLGIYNDADQLVRVLHQEAELNEFSVGADALGTKWDGKDDDGLELPAGKYSARGFLVSAVKVEEVATAGAPETEMANNARLKLVANPLENNERPVIDLAVGFDDENAFLRTADGLPLVTIALTGDAKRAWLTQRSDKTLDAFLENGTSLRQFHLSGVSKMMAFDCGEFELK